MSCKRSIPGKPAGRSSAHQVTLYGDASRYDVDAVILRITEAELASHIHAILARVRDEGLEVIVEQDRKPVVVIRRPEGAARKLSECIAIANAYEKHLGYAPVPDADFAADVQAAINAHREPLNPPEWD